MDALRSEVRQFGIDVAVIEPDDVESEWAGMAVKGARRYSSHGAYAGMQGRLEAPGAAVISDLIVKALEAKRPKTRSHGGLHAGPLLFLRRHLSDRACDRLVSFAMRG